MVPKERARSGKCDRCRFREMLSEGRIIMDLNTLLKKIEEDKYEKKKYIQ